MFHPGVMGSVLIGVTCLLAATQAPASASGASVQAVAVAAKSKSWREVAIADIERAHALVREAHPGVIEGDEHFRAWSGPGSQRGTARRWPCT